MAKKPRRPMRAITEEATRVVRRGKAEFSMAEVESELLRLRSDEKLKGD